MLFYLATIALFVAVIGISCYQNHLEERVERLEKEVEKINKRIDNITD